MTHSQFGRQIAKAWFPLVLRIVRIGDSYDFPILGFLRLLRFLGHPGSHSRKNRRLFVVTCYGVETMIEKFCHLKFFL